MDNVSWEGQWIFVRRTHGLQAGNEWDFASQAGMALLRVRMALGRTGCGMSEVTEGRWLVPVGGALVPRDRAWGWPTQFVAAGLFEPGVLVELEVRARRMRVVDMFAPRRLKPGMGVDGVTPRNWPEELWFKGVV